MRRGAEQRERAMAAPSTAAGAPAPVHIGWYSNHLCERGSEIALFDYAHYAERLYGARSFILYDANSPDNVACAITRFEDRFGARVIALGKASGAAMPEIAPALESK